MQFVYGNYTHADNSVSFANIQKTLILARNGRPHMLKIDWAMDGKLVTRDPANPRADVMNQMAGVIAAYSSNYQSVGFPNTPFFINNGDTFGGVIVTRQPGHHHVRGAEMTTYLNYSFGIETLIPYAATGQVLDFSETISFTDNGGLPISIERLPQNGPPILQQVTQGSWFFATQSGTAAFAFSQSGPNPPLFPALLRTSGNQAKQVTYESPKLVRGQPAEYRVSWKYEYISATPMFALPGYLG